MVDQDYKQRLEIFSLNLRQKLRSYREEKRRDPFFSTDFNVVSEFVRPNENRLSNIIACLLDANGSHGQGDKFLNAFLKRLFEENQPNRLPELSGKQPKVKREDPTLYGENPKRRIDITIDFKGFGKSFGIGIENKPWAKEGDGQLAAYYNHLKGKYKDEEFCLIFITRDGRHPDTIEDNPKDLIDEGKLYCLSYRSDILEWIEECWQLCENHKFRWFLCDFREYIRAEFLPYRIMEKNNDESKRDIILEHALKNDNLKIVLDIVFVGSELEIRRQIAKPFQMEISERDIMLNHILENEKNLEIALDIISADSDLRQRITNNFREKLQVFLKNKKELTESQFKWQFEWEGDFQEVLGVRSKAEDLPEVRIWITGPKTDRLFIGIYVESLEPLSKKWYLLKSKLEDKLEQGGDRKNQHWIWKTRDWEYTDWTDKDTLIKMHIETDCVVEEIGEYFLEIVIKAESVIDEWVKENAHNG